MKQRWLIKPLSASESTLNVALGSHTHLELVALMATAIESVHRLQASLPQQAKETSTHEQTATASQD